MAKQNAVDKAIAKVDAEIATLQAVRARLHEHRSEKPAKERKPRKAKSEPSL